jgi:hypothetical protein
MKFYKCYIAVDGWSNVYFENVEHIWANSPEEAKSEYIKMYGFRKNKKGLTIEEVPYRRVKRIKKMINQVVTHKQSAYLGGYEYGVNEDVAHYYCSNCGKEVHNNRYCNCCDAEMVG